MDRPSPPTPLDARNGHSENDGSESKPPSTMKTLIAVALIATVLGAVIGTTMTLLVGNAGPEGKQGPVGVEGPRGPQGPQGDLSSAQQRISDLADRVSALSSQVNSSPSSDIEDQVSKLDQRISDLESLSSDLCYRGDLIC